MYPCALYNLKKTINFEMFRKCEGLEEKIDVYEIYLQRIYGKSER